MKKGKIEKININKEILCIGTLECGDYQNIELKVGRRIKMLDISKNSECTRVEMYDKKSNDRGSYSKYDSSLHCVNLKKEQCCDREFFENFVEISKAQLLLKNFGML